MRESTIDLRFPKYEFIPVTKRGTCAKWNEPRYRRVKKLPKVEKSKAVNVEKFIGRILL